MPTTTNGEVSPYFEAFGKEGAPVLLLVNGLGSQCINFKVELCEMFAAEGLGHDYRLISGPAWWS